MVQAAIVIPAFVATTHSVGCARSADTASDDRVLYEDDFGSATLDFEKTWDLEGTGSARIANGRLEMQEYPDGVGVVLWLREEFPSGVQFTFDLSFTNNRCIGVFFFASAAADGSDMLTLSTPRTGAYDEYIRGDVDGYSLSLHRYWPDGRNNPGSNLRRNSGFHLLSQVLPDPVLDAERVYRIGVTKRSEHLAVHVDGILVHDVTDDGSLGPPLGAGRIGFRLRGDATCVMLIDDVRIVGLSP